MVQLGGALDEVPEVHQLLLLLVLTLLDLRTQRRLDELPRPGSGGRRTADRTGASH